MAIFLTPGPIEHLDHARQPQAERWEESFYQAGKHLAVLASVLTGQENPGYHVTRKVDDGMSIRIARYVGVNTVGYKGSKSPLFVSEGMIDEYYDDKPAVAEKLKGVLRHCQGLEIPDRCYIQAGYLGHHDDGLPDYVTPNLLEYEVENGSKLAIVPISANFVSATGVDTRTAIGHVFEDRSGATFQYDNVVRASEPYLIGSEAADLVDELRYVLGLAAKYGRKFFDSDAVTTVNHSALLRYLNESNRNGTDLCTADYIDSTYALAEKHANSLKTVEGKARVMNAAQRNISEIKDHELAYFSMLRMMEYMRMASSLLTETVDGEGFTVGTLPDEDGNYTCMKVVNPTYTAMNHSKWNQR